MAEVGSKLAGASSTRVFEQQKRDVQNDSIKKARDVGQVRVNNSRLNIFSSLSDGDKEDFFKFRIASQGHLNFGASVDSETHIQFYNTQGRLIADSDSSTSDKYEKYLSLRDGEGEKLKPGDYFIKVSRYQSDESSRQRPYALQLKMGDRVIQDYDTTEYQAKDIVPGAAVPPIDPTDGATPSAATTQNGMAIGMLIYGLESFNNIVNQAQDLFSIINRR